MSFTKLLGNEAVKSYLTRLIKTGSIGNSWLFAGPEGANKKGFALAFGEALLGKANHPDLFLYSPEGKSGMHSIESMREFSHEVYLAPYNGTRKLFIIDQADRMLPTSANALLKTFEEPALHSIIILLSAKPERLLPTVLSRCRRIRFQGIDIHPVDQELLEALTTNNFRGVAKRLGKSLEELREMRAKETKEAIIATLSDTPTAMQREAIEKESEGTATHHFLQEVDHLFNAILGWFRDLQLLEVKGNTAYLIHPEENLKRGRMLPLKTVQKAISQARLALERSGAPAVVFESLFLKLGGAI